MYVCEEEIPAREGEGVAGKSVIMVEGLKVGGALESAGEAFLLQPDQPCF